MALYFITSCSIGVEVSLADKEEWLPLSVQAQERMSLKRYTISGTVILLLLADLLLILAPHFFYVRKVSDDEV
jgi:hypothetical protein